MMQILLSMLHMQFHYNWPCGFSETFGINVFQISLWEMFVAEAAKQNDD